MITKETFDFLFYLVLFFGIVNVLMPFIYLFLMISVKKRLKRIEAKVELVKFKIDDIWEKL